MWTNAEQTDFLYSKILEHQQYQREGRLLHFWPKLYADWTARWPDTGKAAAAPAEGTAPSESTSTPEPQSNAPPLESTTNVTTASVNAGSINDDMGIPLTQPAIAAAAESTDETPAATAAEGPTEQAASSKVVVKRREPPALMDRLKQWFSNRRGARSDVPARKRVTLPLNGKATRKPLVRQVYQRLFLDKLKPILEQRYALYIHTVPAGQRPQPLVAFRNELARELLAAETQDVRDLVYEEWSKSKGRLTPGVKTEVKDKDLTDADRHQMQLAYYETNIGNLKATLQSVLRDVYLQTGWVLHIQGGGRRPGNKGAVQCISAHTRLPDGRNFANFNNEYFEDVQKPFGNWVLSLFPAKEQDHYNLTSPGALLGIMDAAPEVRPAHENGTFIGGVEHLEPFAVDAFPTTKDAQDAPTTAAKRPKPRPTKTKKGSKTSVPSRGRSPTPPPAPGSIVAMSRRPVQRTTTDDDLALDSDQDEDWQNVNYDFLDKDKEPSPEPQPRAEEPRGTPYEQAARERAETNRKLLFDLTKRAREQLGLPSSGDKAPQMPALEVQPTDRTSRSKSRDSVSSRASSTARSQAGDTDFDAVNDDDDQETIDTYNKLLDLIDTEVYPLWESIIDKGKTLEHVLDYPSSTNSKHRFSTKFRPAQVAAWIKRHRQLNVAPNIDDVDLFVSEMQDWYYAAQPAPGRGDDFPLDPSELDNGQWERLIRGGANGWQIFLIALTWWYDLLMDDAASKRFELVLADVDWVLSRVLNAARARGAGSKRSAPSGSSPNAKRAKA